MAMHENIGQSDEWYTPKYIFDALDCYFDLDVASPKYRVFSHVPALEFFSENSLSEKWFGFVWMNPPFGHQKEKIKWLNKFINHNNGIALLPDRTSAPWWQQSAKQMDAILFVNGKIKFIRPDGSIGEQPGNGTTLFAKGSKAVNALLSAERKGLGILLTKP